MEWKTAEDEHIVDGSENKGPAPPTVDSQHSHRAEVPEPDSSLSFGSSIAAAAAACLVNNTQLPPALAWMAPQPSATPMPLAYPLAAETLRRLENSSLRLPVQKLCWPDGKVVDWPGSVTSSFGDTFRATVNPPDRASNSGSVSPAASFDLNDPLCLTPPTNTADKSCGDRVSPFELSVPSSPKPKSVFDDVKLKDSIIDWPAKDKDGEKEPEELEAFSDFLNMNDAECEAFVSTLLAM